MHGLAWIYFFQWPWNKRKWKISADHNAMKFLFQQRFSAFGTCLFLHFTPDFSSKLTIFNANFNYLYTGHVYLRKVYCFVLKSFTTCVTKSICESWVVFLFKQIIKSIHRKNYIWNFIFILRRIQSLEAYV